MKIQDKPTQELENMLSGIKPSELNNYYKNNNGLMKNDKSFYQYMKEIYDERAIKLKNVYIAAGVSESYGGQILRMEKKTKNRDLIIRLCIAGHFQVSETSRALKLYGMNPLYAKDKRDVCIMVAINNCKYDLTEIDDLLEGQGFDILSDDELFSVL